jgi:hypothetical protein
VDIIVNKNSRIYYPLHD